MKLLDRLEKWVEDWPLFPNTARWSEKATEMSHGRLVLHKLEEVLAAYRPYVLGLGFVELDQRDEDLSVKIFIGRSDDTPLQKLSVFVSTPKQPTRRVFGREPVVIGLFRQERLEKAITIDHNGYGSMECDLLPDHRLKIV